MRRGFRSVARAAPSGRPRAQRTAARLRVAWAYSYERLAVAGVAGLVVVREGLEVGTAANAAGLRSGRITRYPRSARRRRGPT